MRTGDAVYVTYDLRRFRDVGRGQETLQRARDEFFPRLRQAPGFVSFTLVNLGDGLNLAVIQWESREQADDFQAEAEQWRHQVLDQVAPNEGEGAGEVVAHVKPGP